MPITIRSAIRLITTGHGSRLGSSSDMASTIHSAMR